MPRKKTRPDNGTTLPVETDGKEPIGRAVARKVNSPFTRHGMAAMEFQGQMTRGLPASDAPSLIDFAADLKARGEKLGEGDLQLAGHMLASQAITLDAIFTETARRSGLNMVDYPDASERYMRLALKAQANSRATLEALTKLHSPREQTVRHVHVNQGGRAVIADQVHNHTGGNKNAKPDEQPHTPKSGAAGKSPALPGQDSIRPTVPRASDKGTEAMQDARRQGKRRT